MTDSTLSLILTAVISVVGTGGGMAILLSYLTSRRAQKASEIVAAASIMAEALKQKEVVRIGDIERLEKRVAVLEAREEKWIEKYASKEEIESLKETIEEMRLEIASLKQQLVESRSKER